MITSWGQRVARRTRTTARFRIAEYAHPPHCEISLHAHAHPTLCLLVAGEYETQIDRRSLVCGPQQVTFKPRGELHTDRFGPAGGRCLVISYVGPSTEVPEIQMASLLTTSLVGTQRTQALGMSLYAEFGSTEVASTLAIEGLAFGLIAETARQSSARAENTFRTPPFALLAAELIESRFAESLGVERLAKLVGVHRATLAREFKLAFGCTPGMFLRRTRISHAIRALQRDQMPLGMLAATLGFADQSHFTRVFRRELGVSPHTFRVALQEGSGQSTGYQITHARRGSAD
jgi:AraC family transcriptional regulator